MSKATRRLAWSGILRMTSSRRMSRWYNEQSDAQASMERHFANDYIETHVEMVHFERVNRRMRRVRRLFEDRLINLGE